MMKPKAKQGLTLVGTVPAGFPVQIDGEQPSDINISLDDLLIRHPEATFLMRVSGLSMKNIGIYEGDIVVVDRSLQAKSGDIVVAFINQSFTLKRLKRQGSAITLVAEHEAMPPIRVAPEDDMTVWGVATAVVRSLKTGTH